MSSSSPILTRLRGLGIAEDTTTYDSYTSPTAPTGATLFCKETIEIKPKLDNPAVDHTHQLAWPQVIEVGKGIRSWDVSIPFTVPTQGLAFNLILKQLFGGVTTNVAGGTLPVYSHTYILPRRWATVGLSLTQLLGDNFSQYEASGGRVSGLTLSQAMNGQLSCTATLTGATFVEAAQASLPASDLVASDQYWMYHLQATNTIGGTAVGMHSWSLSIKPKGIQPFYVVGKEAATSILFSGMWDITGNFVRKFAADASSGFQSQYLVAARDPALQTYALVLGYTVGDLALLRSLNIAAEIQVIAPPTQTVANGIVTETVNFRVASYDATNPLTIVTSDALAAPATAAPDA